MVREGILIGVLSLTHSEVRSFTEKQIELASTFADQAAIAIENVRLFDEVQARARELSESLERQTATSEVLGVISRSPGELAPVFQTMLANATRICEAKFGNLFLCEGDEFRLVAMHGAPTAWAEWWRREPVIRPGPGTGLGRVARTKQVVHIADLTKEQAYIERDPLFVGQVELAGGRTLLVVPMLKENELIGAIGIFRHEVCPFSDKQIELVRSFANQAVIAIENTRLLNELRQRTDDLSEALEQQTGTSEVLQVISSSPGELEPVFHALLKNAARLCEANFGSLYLYDGEMYRVGALHNTPKAFAELRRREPVFRAGPANSLGRAVATKQVIHIADISTEQAYADRDPLRVAGVELLGARTLLMVPMLKDGRVTGLISICRLEVQPFTDKQ